MKEKGKYIESHNVYYTTLYILYSQGIGVNIHLTFYSFSYCKTSRTLIWLRQIN